MSTQILISSSGVQSVTASSPIASTGGNNPNLTIQQANASQNGFLFSADWSTFNSKQDALVSGTNIKTVNGSSILGSGNLVISGGVTSVTGTSPITSSGGATPAISIATASAGSSGALSSTDWSTFNNKQAALVSGTNIKTINGTSILGSGNIVAGGNKASVGLPTFTSNTVPSGATNTLVFSANVFSAAGQIVDLDFLVRSTTSFVPRLRFYVNSSNTLTGATQLVFFDGPSTINNVVRYFRRYAVTLESGTTFALYGAEFSAAFSDFSPDTQPFISFSSLGFAVLTNTWILITLNNSGQLLAGTVEY
jgi:hypothetical protein